ncbi:MAG TPA: MIP/aquaporin family protein [Candidatus Acidoferrales bacterium]|nr:MIP/aquaporin family protein [Candidatus Acidoferrales bacterium]
MTSPFLGEFLGTLVLVLLGDGAVANVLLKKSKGEGSGWIVITTGWCFAVMAGVFTAVACGSKDGYINPAVTLGFAVASGGYSKLAPYFVAQILGAFAGAVLVWLFYLPHWRETTDPSLKLGVFCTSPAIRKTLSNLTCEIIATFLLVFLGAALASKAVASSSGLVGGLGGYLAGAIVWAIGLSLGGTTGYAINPARDLGPRTAHAILPIAGKGSSDWRYSPIPVFGPLIGGGLAGVLIRYLGI